MDRVLALLLDVSRSLAGLRDVTNNLKLQGHMTYRMLKRIETKQTQQAAAAAEAGALQAPLGGSQRPAGAGGEQREPRDTRYTLVSAPRGEKRGGCSEAGVLRYVWF